jgi:hypothetical protein
VNHFPEVSKCQSSRGELARIAFGGNLYTDFYLYEKPQNFAEESTTSELSSDYEAAAAALAAASGVTTTTSASTTTTTSGSSTTTSAASSVQPSIAWT